MCNLAEAHAALGHLEEARKWAEKGREIADDPNVKKKAKKTKEFPTNDPRECEEACAVLLMNLGMVQEVNLRGEGRPSDTTSGGFDVKSSCFSLFLEPLFLSLFLWALIPTLTSFPRSQYLIPNFFLLCSSPVTLQKPLYTTNARAITLNEFTSPMARARPMSRYGGCELNE